MGTCPLTFAFCSAYLFFSLLFSRSCAAVPVLSASFITILSYNGAVQMGCLSDSRVIAEPRELTDLFVSEFIRLQKKIAELQKEGKLQRTLQLQEKDKA